MQLSNLLETRHPLAPGEVVTVGIGIARAASALLLVGGTLHRIRPDDVTVLSDGTATLSDEYQARCTGNPTPVAACSQAPTAELLFDYLRNLTPGFQQSRSPQAQSLWRYLNDPGNGALMIGDFAIGLTRACAPEPIGLGGDSYKWLSPALLGFVALASWGIAIGLLVGLIP